MKRFANDAESKLHGFFEVLSEELNGKAPSEPERVFAKDRLVQRMRKRARFFKPDLEQKAIDQFVLENDTVRSHRLSLDPQLVRDAKHFITVVLERFNTRLDPDNVQVTLDLNHLIDHWRFGPGASNGVRGTHTAEKIEQAMTCTLLCAPYVAKLRRSNTYFRLYDESRGSLGITPVYGARLTTVLKNEDTVRTIGIEPSGNMVWQLAAGRYLEQVLSYIGLNIQSQQPKNKALARRGSLDGSIATLDLKSASNMQGIRLVSELMPPDWVKLLVDLRSPSIKLPDGKLIDLHMMSPMGNGFTFPLMTLVIVALLYGFRAQRGGPNLRIDWKNTAVFGDDIIIPVSEVDGFKKVLADAGFVVNHDKSYSEGPFRESCGGDYFEGYDVTPFYVKSLATDPEIYVAINQVLEWSAKHNFALPITLLYLKNLLRGKPHLVPEWHNPDQGVLTAQCPRRYKYLRPMIHRVRLQKSSFEMPLAVGGYLTSSPVEDNLDLFFSPRPFKTRYKIKAGRLPRGYLSGVDPLKRDVRVSTYIGSVTDLLFAEA